MILVILLTLFKNTIRMNLKFFDVTFIIIYYTRCIFKNNNNSLYYVTIHITYMDSYYNDYFYDLYSLLFAKIHLIPSTVLLIIIQIYNKISNMT